MVEEALRFAALFDGRRDALGHGEGRVERKTVTLKDYEGHLNGEGKGIGIFPLRDDATVRFAAIDLDEPNFDLARQFQRLIPGTSFIERSRSGNAHVWVFFDKPCPGWVARGWLRHVCEAFGRPDVETFPKQDAVREGGVGNYINLPYHGEDRPMLIAAPGNYDAERPGSPHMTLERFLDRAEGALQDPESWERRCLQAGIKPPEERERKTEFGQAAQLHECATYILQRSASGEQPIMQGSRHQVLFHVACQLLNWRDLTTDEAWDLIVQLDDESDKPLDPNELTRLFDNALKGEFTFTGCDDPVMRPYVHPDCPIANGKAGS